MADDIRLMSRALALAQKGYPRATPNPMVGCVLVKNGRIIAEGYHKEFGGPHAEIVALKKAGSRAKGATAYVNLEPCSHWGKTPPCVDSLTAAGVKEIVAATTDPNPKVRGRGVAGLRRHGIKVRVGPMAKEARELNLPFFTQMTLNRPYIILKTAATFDGKIADFRGKSKWITSSQTRQALWDIRGRADAILVGVNTVLADDPELTSHGRGRNPLRIILDPRLRIKPGAKVLNTANAGTILVSGTEDYGKFKLLTNKDVEIMTVGLTQGRLDLKEMLRLLALKGTQTVLVEGGGETHGRFVEEGLLDEILWFVAPKIVGGKTAKSPVGGRGLPLDQSIDLRGISGAHLNGDLVFRGSCRPEGLLWPLIQFDSRLFHHA